MDPRTETRRVLDALRQLIKESSLSQRKVEERAGFSRGYLSQLLAANLDLKFVHIIAVLDTLEVAPGPFFGRLYPDLRSPALESFKERSRMRSVNVRRDLDELYDDGLESLQQLRSRLERCESAVDRLEELGILPHTSEGGESA